MMVGGCINCDGVEKLYLRRGDFVQTAFCSFFVYRSEQESEIIALGGKILLTCLGQRRQCETSTYYRTAAWFTSLIGGPCSSLT